MISLWENQKEAGKKISVDFRNFLVIFEALWDPPRAPRVPKMENSVPWEVETEYFTMRWFHLKKMCVTHIEGGQMTKENDLRHALAIFKLWGPSQSPLKGPNCSKWTTFHENSRRYILHWEDFTMGTPGDIYMESGQRIVWWFEAYFSCFLFLKGALKGPQGSLMYPNG